MVWFADLSPCDYFGFEDDSRFRAVGWLERGRDFTVGKVDERCVGRLAELLAEPWQPVHFLGFHQCDLCEVEQPPEAFRLGRWTVSLGATNLFLPAPGIGILVAPSMVVHYICDHGYRPPDVFLRAVMDCPAMGSRRYLDAIRAGAGDHPFRVGDRGG